MMIVAIIFALFSLISLIYIWVQQKQYQKLFRKINKLFDDAANGDIKTISYDESVTSALSDKIIRYINANKIHLADIKNERNKIKTLISDISHQTKTPITNILLYSGLLLERGDLDKDALQMLGNIQAQSEKLKFLLNALVKMSRFETGVLEVHTKMQNIKPLISAAISEAYPAIAEKGIDLHVSIGESLMADFDMKWTKEAIYNILDNAIKYTDSGGSIKVTVTTYEMFAKIDIDDTGVGINQDEYTEIFKRFYRSPRTREQDGIGVGLYLAREIIVLQGGYIKVASKLNCGSVFLCFSPYIEICQNCYI